VERKGKGRRVNEGTGVDTSWPGGGLDMVESGSGVPRARARRQKTEGKSQKWHVHLFRQALGALHHVNNPDCTYYWMSVRWARRAPHGGTVGVDMCTFAPELLWAIVFESLRGVEGVRHVGVRLCLWPRRECNSTTAG
jgi:hypothetical protein